MDSPPHSISDLSCIVTEIAVNWLPLLSSGWRSRSQTLLQRAEIMQLFAIVMVLAMITPVLGAPTNDPSDEPLPVSLMLAEVSYRNCLRQVRHDPNLALEIAVLIILISNLRLTT